MNNFETTVSMRRQTNNFHMTMKSGNAKTGKIPVSTTSDDTCPVACPFRHDNEGGCYAGAGPLKLHWMKVSDGRSGGSIEDLAKAIRSFKNGQLWRHNQAGDLPGDGVNIDREAMDIIVNANAAVNGKGFTYTHYPLTANNMEAIKASNDAGFTVNVSANSVQHADQLRASGVDAPMVAVVPVAWGRELKAGKYVESLNDYRKRMKTLPLKAADRENGQEDLTICPATYTDNVTCESCGFCAKQDRKTAVVFPAHGNGKKKAGNVASMEVAFAA